MKKKITKTIYRVDMPKLKHYAAKVASNGINLTGYQASVDMLQEIIFAQKGADKRTITPDEATIMIYQGGFK